MSKSTRKYGEIVYRIYMSDGSFYPDPAVKQQQETLNKLAIKYFHHGYWNLSEKERSDLHFNLNAGKYQHDDIKGQIRNIKWEHRDKD